MQVYKMVCGLSYLGDFRMYVRGEDPQKVHNIVTAQYDLFDGMYAPLFGGDLARLDGDRVLINNDPAVHAEALYSLPPSVT